MRRLGILESRPVAWGPAKDRLREEAELSPGSLRGMILAMPPGSVQTENPIFPGLPV